MFSLFLSIYWVPVARAPFISVWLSTFMSYFSVELYCIQSSYYTIRYQRLRRSALIVFPFDNIRYSLRVFYRHLSRICRLLFEINDGYLEVFSIFRQDLSAQWKPAIEYCQFLTIFMSIILTEDMNRKFYWILWRNFIDLAKTLGKHIKSSLVLGNNVFFQTPIFNLHYFS